MMVRHPGMLRRRRAGLRDGAGRPPRLRIPSVFSSLLLVGAAGMLTTLGIFLATQLIGPGGVRHPGANAPAIVRQLPPSTESATPTPLPTATPTPLPTARVYLLPTPTPESWCDHILGWSSITDSLCHPFGG